MLWLSDDAGCHRASPAHCVFEGVTQSLPARRVRRLAPDDAGHPITAPLGLGHNLPAPMWGVTVEREASPNGSQSSRQA